MSVNYFILFLSLFFYRRIEISAPQRTRSTKESPPTKTTLLEDYSCYHWQLFPHVKCVSTSKISPFWLQNQPMMLTCQTEKEQYPSFKVLDNSHGRPTVTQLNLPEIKKKKLVQFTCGTASLTKYVQIQNVVFANQFGILYINALWSEKRDRISNFIHLCSCSNLC